MSPPRRSCRSSPTTRRRARKQCRLDEAGATAPTTAWPPSVAETSEARDCPNGKGKDNFGKGKGAYEWGKSNYDGNKGSNYGMYKGGGKSGHWKLGRLGSRTRTCSVIATRGACRSTASAARNEEEVHDVCGYELQLQGWTSTSRR